MPKQDQNPSATVRPITVVISDVWLEFVRRNLVSPREFGGALDFKNGAIDSAVVVMGSERKVASLDYGEEIGYHAHPVASGVIFAPSGADYAALSLAATRYYGGSSAPNQQASVVFAGNGTYVLYATDALRRRLGAFIECLGSESESEIKTQNRKKDENKNEKKKSRLDRVRERLMAHVEDVVNQALETDWFVDVDATGGSGGDAIVTVRGRLGRHVVYSLRAPESRAKRWRTLVRSFRDERAKPTWTTSGGDEGCSYAPLFGSERRNGWSRNELAGEVFESAAGVTRSGRRTIVSSVAGTSQDHEREQIARLTAAAEERGATVRTENYALIPARLKEPEVFVTARVGSVQESGARSVRGSLGGGESGYEVLYSPSEYSRRAVSEAARFAAASAMAALSGGAYSKTAWRDAILGKGEASFLSALSSMVDGSVRVGYSATFYISERDISDVRFAVGADTFCVPPWAMDPRNPKMRLVSDTAAALGYRLDFFAGDSVPELSIRPVPRKDAEVLPFGRKRKPIRIKKIAGFAKKPARKRFAVQSFQYE